MSRFGKKIATIQAAVLSQVTTPIPGTLRPSEHAPKYTIHRNAKTPYQSQTGPERL